MSRKFNKLPSLSNVAAGNTAVLEVPRGVTYDRILLEYSGVTLEQMKNVQVLINGKAIWNFANAKMLNDLNKYYPNRNPESGILDFWFIRPEYDSIDLRRMTAIGTADVSTFEIKLDIDEDAENPQLTAHAIKSPNTKLGMITKHKMFPKASSVAGDIEIDNLPKEGRWAAVHFYGNKDIKKIELEADSNKVMELSKRLGEKWQRDKDRTPLGALGSSMDFTLEGSPLNAFNPVLHSDLRFRLTLAEAGSMTVLVEYLTEFAGL